MHPNKWIRYARGTAVPQRALIEVVDARYPGSAAAINHPLWLLMDRQFPSLGQLARVKTYFAPQVQVEIDAVGSTPQWESPHLAILYVKKLILLEPLDALGAIVYLLWHAKLRADTFAQASWVRCAYIAMLVHGAELLSFGIALPMFELLKQNLLSAVEHNGTRFDYPSRHYLLGVELLGNLYRHWGFGPLQNRRKFLYDASTSKHGHAPIVITWPIPVPASGCLSVENTEEFETYQRVFSWAIFTLSTNNPSFDLPDGTGVSQFPLIFGTAVPWK
jgi:hypothetical protein